MKSILSIAGIALLGLPLYSQTNVFLCTAANSSITNLEFSGTQELIEKPCVVFDNPAPYSFTGSNLKTIKGINNIHLKTDFYAKPGGNGSLSLKLGKSDFDVACMNYSFNQLKNVQRFKKFEIGITLPNEIQERVTAFLSGETNPDLCTNPYVSWDLKVYVEYTLENFPGALHVEGFYDQKYESWMNNPIQNISQKEEGMDADVFYNLQGGYTPIPTDYPFLIRFSPPETGNWTGKVKIVAPGMYYESEAFQFTVVESDNPGYIHTDLSNRFFKLGQDYFRPLGANILWPMTHNDVKHNPGINNQKIENILHDGFTLVLSEDYRNVKPIPVIFNGYRNHIRNIADGGGNFVRLCMHPFSQDIEFEKLGDYTERLYIAQEMDKNLEYCESRGVYIDWDFQYQGILNPAYQASWYKQYIGKNFCYKELIKERYPDKVNDEAFMNNPGIFFKDEEVKKYYKEKIRYTIARWGYSTNIAMFELFSEITSASIFTQNQAEINDKTYRFPPDIVEIIESWHREMAAYVKSLYNGKTHMVQASYGGVLHQLEDKSFYSENIDIVTKNLYPGTKTYANKWINELQHGNLNQSDEELDDPDPNRLMGSCKKILFPEPGYTCDLLMKPFFMPEVDPSGENSVQNFSELCDDKQIEAKRTLWQIPFSGAAGGLSWNAYHNGYPYQEFANIKRFMGHMNQVEGWHPGAMERLFDGRWAYKSNWAKDMDHDRSENDNEKDPPNNKVDLMYLRSADKNYAFGVITNKTYNMESVDTCFNRLVLTADPEHPIVNFDGLMETNEKGMINTENWNLKLHGMNPDKYYITYFYPNQQNEPFDSDDAYGEIIPLNVKVPASYNRFVVLFMARRADHPWKALSINDSLTEMSYQEDFKTNEQESSLDASGLEIKIYPVPTRDKIIIENSSDLSRIEIRILSMEGKLIQTQILDRTMTEVDLSHFEKGVYLLKFFKEGLEFKQNKIIKL